jgi:hydrogenase nickel incorporation protein HypA/HybF
MHEFSTMQQIVTAILQEAQRRRATDIGRVKVEIGELTFLGTEQLTFAFSILKENTLLANATLDIKVTPAAVQCKTCDYTGGIEHGFKDEFHLSFPLLKCPLCGGDVDVIAGKECLIKSVELEVENCDTS